jgi:D-3-phosphoglycerate dehydrogenase / 2-oxoglutarate reductase
MPKFKVVILPHGYPSVEIEREVVEGAGGVLVDGDTFPNEAAALQAAADADAILVRWTKVTPEVIGHMKRCRIIVRYGIGYDNVDYASALAAGIMIGHCPTYCVDEVATHTLALLLACVRDIVNTHAKVARGGWTDNPSARQWRMAGRTIGLIGLGNIGRCMAAKLKGWGLRVLATDPFVEEQQAAAVGAQLVDFRTLCREADYICVHAPLLPETHHLINREVLAFMKDGVILVNTARGPLVDEAALLEALEAGKVAAAGLDVFEREPLASDSRLRSHPKLVLSDHGAWYSENSLAELKRSVAEDAVRVCIGGLPLAIAYPEVLHKLGRFHEWTPNSNAVWQMKRAATLSGKG